MSDSKKLRISEIRNNVFVIERHDEGYSGKWITLNLKGEEKQDVYTGSGVVVVDDPCEYTDLKSAEQAMAGFLIFPRVIKTSDDVITKTDTHRLEEILTKITECKEEFNVIAEKLNYHPIKINIKSDSNGIM